MAQVIFAFDVDDTLEVSRGPIEVNHLRNLAMAEGHIVGICGNWALFVAQVPDWHRFVSFIGPMEMTKEAFLRQVRTFIPAHRYLMVGNRGPDDTAALEAGWEFVAEERFAVSSLGYG